MCKLLCVCTSRTSTSGATWADPEGEGPGGSDAPWKITNSIKFPKTLDLSGKVSKGAKIRNRYNIKYHT